MWSYINIACTSAIIRLCNTRTLHPRAHPQMRRFYNLVFHTSARTLARIHIHHRRRHNAGAICMPNVRSQHTDGNALGKTLNRLKVRADCWPEIALAQHQTANSTSLCLTHSNICARGGFTVLVCHGWLQMYLTGTYFVKSCRHSNIEMELNRE